MILFHHNYKVDDIILSTTPIILLFWFNVVNTINQFLIIFVIFTSLIYWNHKNLYTFFADTLAAILFISYNLYRIFQKFYFTYCIYLIFLLLFFFGVSYIQGQNGNKQLLYHLIFRTLCFIIFIISIY